jgi:small-conductance mechanosensitive channel
MQMTFFPQSNGIEKLKTDSTQSTKVDSLTVRVDNSLTKVVKDTSKGNSLELSPPSILDIISFGKIIWSIIFVIVGFYIIRLITKVLELFAERSISYRITLKGIVPIIRISGWIIIIYILIAGIFKPPISAVIAVTASIGIAIGFAAQDILKNIFGGVMILFDRPFQVGDKIQVGDYYGEVIKIGLRSTRVVTPDDSTVTIPNGEIMNKSVSNTNFGEPYCQVVAEIYLPINVDTNKVREIATEAAQVSKYIFLNKPITVLFFNEVKEERVYLKMRLKAYVMDIRFEFNFKSDMTEIVMRELLSQKIISPDNFNKIN